MSTGSRLSPCGESVLKYHLFGAGGPLAQSLPVWGEWIEIWESTAHAPPAQSLPVWGEWIEMRILAGPWG